MVRPLKVIAGSPDRPLVIDDIEIPCYVLEGEIRVLSQRGFANVFDLNGGGEMPRLISRDWVKPFLGNEITVVVSSPIPFAPPGGGKPAYGYPASVLVDICKAILTAEAAGAVTGRQRRIVRNARVLLFAVAKTGMDGLVDERTGYQEIRDRNALAKVLEKYIAKERQPWIRTYPFEFYAEIFRLRGWEMDPITQRPSVIGHITNDLVYRRIAPGILQTVRHLNPVVSATGRRRHKHHQWFTRDYGHPELRDHLTKGSRQNKVVERSSR